MKITKLFEVESAHIVRNCTSERCSHSIHGHSAKIEVTLESKSLDNAQMVYDFGLMKNSIKQFIDSMDHSYLLCDKDKPEFQTFITNECDRYIIFPFNPSAEMLSLYILRFINFILMQTNKNNGEGFVRCTAVRYWETRTGSATATLSDIENIWGPVYDQIIYSNGIRKDWSEDLLRIIECGERVENPVIEKQINL